MPERMVRGITIVAGRKRIRLTYDETQALYRELHDMCSTPLTTWIEPLQPRAPIPAEQQELVDVGGTGGTK